MKPAPRSVIGWGLGLGLAFLAVSCTKPDSGSSSGCGQGQMDCNGDGTCVNLRSDSENCGACGYSCSTGTTCQAGQCACAPGLVACDNACVSSNTDHCGSSCTTCPAGNVCTNGQCMSSCPSGATLCSDGACSSAGDTAHCGASCTACGAGQSCVSGACVGGVGGSPGSGGVSGGAGGATGGGTGGVTGGATGGVSGGGTGGVTGGATGGVSGGAGGAIVTQPPLVTSAANAYWKTDGQWTVVTTGTADVTVNDASTQQTWEGFGGAFNELGWTRLQLLSQTDRDNALQLLFGSGTSGAHFVIGRIPIGSSDYATSRYTDDETANDTSLSAFSIDRDMTNLIPYVKAAMKINPSIRFWASPWTPPTWMKTNSGSVNGTSCAISGSTVFDGGCMQDIAANLTALAQYLVRWVQAYQQQGITIETVAPQNEPNYATGYSSALWASPLYAKFVGQYLAPAFATATPNTKIMLGTMSNGNSGTDPSVVTTVMGDATAKNVVKVIGLQWGMLDNYKSNPSSFNMYNLPIWATEHKCGNYPWNTSTYKQTAPNDQAYGVESWGFIRDAIKTGVTAYNAWNMVLDTVGLGSDTASRPWAQNALLTVNTSTMKLNITPAYYVFRHVSQFVAAGAKAVATSGNGSADAVAFKNPDGSIVTVMYNSGATKTSIVAVGGKKLQFAFPGSGWATVYYKP
jgi:glucosylceramidase